MNCVVVPLNNPKQKPFQSFSIQISWSSSHRLPQSDGWHSSFIFGSPRFRYQPVYRLHWLIIQWFSLHPSGKWRDSVFKIHRHFFARPLQLTTQPIFPPLGAVTWATDSHARKEWTPLSSLRVNLYCLAYEYKTLPLKLGINNKRIIWGGHWNLSGQFYLNSYPFNINFQVHRSFRLNFNILKCDGYV